MTTPKRLSEEDAAMTSSNTQGRAHKTEEIRKAAKYVAHCEDAVTNAMHCSDDVFRRATKELRRAQIRLANLENNR